MSFFLYIYRIRFHSHLSLCLFYFRLLNESIVKSLYNVLTFSFFLNVWATGNSYLFLWQLFCNKITNRNINLVCLFSNMFG